MVKRSGEIRLIRRITSRVIANPEAPSANRNSPTRVLAGDTPDPGIFVPKINRLRKTRGPSLIRTFFFHFFARSRAPQPGKALHEQSTVV